MERLSRVPSAARIAIGLLVVALLALTIGGCGGSSSASDDEEASFTGSGYPGVDAANTRKADSTIDSSNVSSLSVAWKAKIPRRPRGC